MKHAVEHLRFPEASVETGDCGPCTQGNRIQRSGCDLIWAAYYGDLSEVNRLLVTGARINAKDKNGITALMFAT
jgi:ankyrin repeat protein